MKRIFLSTSDVSGDRIGAWLVHLLHRRIKNARLCGIGGPLMAEAGCDVLWNLRTVTFIGTPSLRRFFHFLRLRFIEGPKRLAALLTEQPPDLVILITSAELNLQVASAAKKRGIPTVYFQPPDQWAFRLRWRRRRSIFRRSDWILPTSPFEEAAYRRLASSPSEVAKVVYFGHPLVGSTDQGTKRSRTGTETIAFLPGSRKSEVSEHLGTMVEAAALIAEARGLQGIRVKFLLPVAAPFLDDRVKAILVRSLLALGDRDRPDIRLRGAPATATLARADCAVVASGTAALEAAIVGCPMVVVYRPTALTTLLARILVKETRAVSLPNLLLMYTRPDDGEKVFPELLGSKLDSRLLAGEVLRLLTDENGCLQKQLAGLRRVKELLGCHDPDREIGDFIAGLLDSDVLKTGPISEGDVVAELRRATRSRDAASSPVKGTRNLQVSPSSGDEKEVISVEARRKLEPRSELEMKDLALQHLRAISGPARARWERTQEWKSAQHKPLPSVASLLEVAERVGLIEEHSNPPHVLTAHAQSIIAQYPNLEAALTRHVPVLLDRAFRHLPEAVSEEQLLEELEIQLRSVYDNCQEAVELCAGLAVENGRDVRLKRHTFVVVLAVDVVRRAEAVGLIRYDKTGGTYSLSQEAAGGESR